MIYLILFLSGASIDNAEILQSNYVRYASYASKAQCERDKAHVPVGMSGMCVTVAKAKRT